MNQDSSSELDRAYPAPVVHVIAGRPISFLPLTIKKLSQFARAVKPIMADENIDAILAAVVADNASSVAVQIEDLAIVHVDSLIDAIEAATDCEKSWLESQDIGVLIECAHRVVEVNKSYFLPRMAPRLVSAMLEAMKDGASPLVGSLPTGTDTATLQTTL